MSIEHINGMGAIAGYGDNKDQSDAQDNAQAENFIIEYLIQNYNLSRSQAVATLSAVAASGVNVMEMVIGLQSNNAAIVAQFEAFIH